MKRFSNILVALGVTVFLMIVGKKSEVKAQCLAGFTYKKDTLMIGGCPWEIELCFKCGLSYPGEVKVNSATPIPQFPPCTPVTLQQALDYAYSQLANYDYIINKLCKTYPSIPPCPQQSQAIRIHHNYCWKMTRIIYHGQETIRFTACPSDGCYEDVTFCHDGTNINRISTGYMTGPPTCGLEESMATVPTVVGQSSDCFIYHSPCNP